MALDFMQKPRVQQRMRQLQESQSEEDRLQLALNLFKEIQRASESIVDKIDDGVVVNNFDEVSAALKNETKNNTTRLLKALKQLKISGEEQSRIIQAVQERQMRDTENEFQTIRIKKPRDKVFVENLDEVVLPESMTVDNLQELEQYFDSLSQVIRDNFNIDIPTPEVNVQAPEVNVPDVNVNPEIDISSLKDQIKKVNQSLKKIKNNRSTNPLAVRLSDGEEFIESMRTITDNLNQAFAGFPGTVKIAKNSSVNTNSPKSIASGSKDVSSAGTAEKLVSSSTPCKEVIIVAKSDNTGKIYVGGSSVSSSDGAFIFAGATMRISIDDVSSIWIDADTSNEGVQFTYVT